MMMSIIFQGGAKIPTGGIAHEPFGMIWWDSKADSIVWMWEEFIIVWIMIDVYLRVV